MFKSALAKSLVALLALSLVALAALHQGAQAQTTTKTKTERLLQAGLDPIAVDENSWSHMHWAALLDDDQALKRLIEMGVLFMDPKANPEGDFGDKGKRRARVVGIEMGDWKNRGETPLHIAAHFNSGVAASILIANGANANAKNEDGKTPLQLALLNESTETAALLPGHASSPSGTPTEAALRKCEVWKGQLNPVAVVDTEGNETKILEDVKCERLHQSAHLHFAASANDLNAARWLIDNGAEVNAKKNGDGDTPLHNAAWQNATETAALLLKNGARVNAKNRYDDTPLHDAAWNNATETAALLLKNGARVNAKKDSGGETPLHYAARGNAAETAALLLKNGARVNAKSRGETPLHLAKLGSNVERILLDNGAKIDLFIAIRQNDIESVRRLIHGGADVNARIGSNHMMPLHLAAMHGATEKIAALLLENGARINEITWGIAAGYTPLDVAIAGEHTEMQLFLERYGGRCSKKC